MSGFTLRNAVPGDEDAIRRVVVAVLHEYGFTSEPSGIDADLEDIAVHYHDRSGLFRVLVGERGAVIGCGGLFPLDESDAEVRKMYFLPCARGRGHGRHLLEDLIAHARDAGFRRVVLETSSRLTNAGALYRRFGFVDVVRRHSSARCDTAMALDLA